jgi:hypothetical protein
MGSRRHTTSFSILSLCAGAMLWAAAATGCSKPLLAPNDQRSPFDHYDLVRGNYAPQYVEDKFGRQQPNLRGRLSPKD